MSKILEIDQQKFSPGESGLIEIDIADLPSGTKINLPVHIFRSKKEGPVLLVSAGMHGDEINGVEIVRQSLVKQYYDNLISGTAIIIPLINIYGFINFSRAVPDGKDVNRSFPGSKKGSLAAQVAHVLSNDIFPKINYAVDFHTGGSTRYNYPHIRYTIDDEKSKELALAFDPPVMIGNKAIDKSFRQTALKQGKSTIVFEGGESLRYDGFSIKEALKGLQKLLTYLKMTAPQKKESAVVKEKKAPHNFTHVAWQRAEVSGLFIWQKSSGIFVEEGELLGTIHDPHNSYLIEVNANRSGYIFGHNNATVVNQGDALFHYGW